MSQEKQYRHGGATETQGQDDFTRGMRSGAAIVGAVFLIMIVSALLTAFVNPSTNQNIHHGLDSAHRADSIQKGMQGTIDSLRAELRAYDSLPKVLKSCKNASLQFNLWVDQAREDSARAARREEAKADVWRETR